MDIVISASMGHCISMAWFGRKSKRSSPLWDFVAENNPKFMANFLEKKAETAEDSSTFLMQVIFGLTLVCVADFQRNVGSIVRDSLTTANPDVITFEGLAYSIITIRKFHLPPADYQDLDEPEALVDAYRNVIAMLRVTIENHTGWSIEKEWEARILQHAQFPGIIEATERLNGRLLSLGDVNVPLVLYEKPKTDLSLSLKVAAATQAFTLTMPEATSDTIQNIISEFYLVD